MPKLPTDWDRTIKTSQVYARVDTNHLLIPYDMFKLLEPHIVKLDYDYHGGDRHWRLHKDPQLTVQAMHKDALTAMQVAQKLEQ